MMKDPFYDMLVLSTALSYIATALRYVTIMIARHVTFEV